MSRLSVLVVDDERISRLTTVQQLNGAGYRAQDAANASQAMERLARENWDVVLTDLRMPNQSGMDLLREVRGSFPQVDVLLMTAYGTVQSAVEAIQLGAVDYLVKPFRFAELDLRLGRIQELRSSRAEIGRLRALLHGQSQDCGIVGRSPGIARVRERIGMFAEHSAPVLVTGETGTGKELVARALHDQGKRKGEFIAVACGAIPRELAESQLFGHERGSFTGATQRHRGCFEQAHGGTLLLDDIDDLPGDIQVKLLRAIQEGAIRRVGAEADATVDVRLVATSKIDLTSAVEGGVFRADLYYRLRGLEIELPPLRERGEDILLLAQHFLDLAARRDGSPAKVLAPECSDALRRFAWPGNVRELRATLDSAGVLCGNGPIGPEHLPRRVAPGPESDRLFALFLEERSSVPLQTLVESVEYEVIRWAMACAQGQQTRAAEILAIPRTTLQSKLTKQAKR